MYMMRCGDDHYKVGVATTVSKRLGGLQTSNPNLVEVVAVKLSDDAYALESSIHKYLKDVKADGGKEWFKLTCKEALGIAVLINKDPEVTGLTDAMDVRDFAKLQVQEYKALNQKVNLIFKYVQQNEDAKLKQRQDRIKHNNDNVREERVLLDDDFVYEQAVKLVYEHNHASTSFIQRRLSIGYGRASRLLDRLEAEGIIGPLDGAKARKVFNKV